MRRPSQRGFSYLVLLFFVAIAGAALAVAGGLWSTTSTRARERELLFVGDQFLQAIQSYRDRTPLGQEPRFPDKLEDLLDDRRWPTVQRHLRRIYVDPFTGSRDWALIASPAGGIMGVHSRSSTTPLKRAGFAREYESFRNASTHADWRFSYGMGISAAVGAPASAAAGPVVDLRAKPD